MVSLPRFGGLAQLARALAWQARGQRFESAILHFKKQTQKPFKIKPSQQCEGFFVPIYYTTNLNKNLLSVRLLSIFDTYMTVESTLLYSKI